MNTLFFPYLTQTFEYFDDEINAWVNVTILELDKKKVLLIIDKMLESLTNMIKWGQTV